MIKKYLAIVALLMLSFPLLGVLAKTCLVGGVSLPWPDAEDCPTSLSAATDCVDSGCFVASIGTAVANCQAYCKNPTGSPPSGVVCYCPKGFSSLAEIIGRVTKYLLWAVLIIAPLLVIFGAFQIMTARENPEQVTKGRNLIIWALIGLAIFLLAKILANVITTAFFPGS